MYKRVLINLLINLTPTVFLKHNLTFCRLEKLVNDPTEGNAWHADHIIPVYQGGGIISLKT